MIASASVGFEPVTLLQNRILSFIIQTHSMTGISLALLHGKKQLQYLSCQAVKKDWGNIVESVYILGPFLSKEKMLVIICFKPLFTSWSSVHLGESFHVTNYGLGYSWDHTVCPGHL